MKELNNKKINVLNLVRWYPNRYDPMPGLFIQRHVEASKIYCNPSVVYTHIINDEEPSIYSTDFNVINGIPTAKVYYQSSKCRIVPVKKIINIFRFYKANGIGIKEVRRNNEKHNIVHVHILTRLGLIALIYRIIFGIPYIVTEHWSRYLDLTGQFNGFLRKRITKLIVRKASVVTAVTNNLANAMKKHGLVNPNYIILPNVVDSKFLKVNAKPVNGKFTFIHISCFEDKSKNISGLLRVINSLSILRSDFRFIMVGDGMDYDSLVKYSDDLGIKNGVIHFTGLLEGEALVNQLKIANMLVIFSNYENFPVVINESLSMGIPVISTDVGGISERVNDKNGLLVKKGDEEMMLNRLQDILDNKVVFNVQQIKKDFATQFSPEAIGKTIFNIYKTSIENNQ